MWGAASMIDRLGKASECFGNLARRGDALEPELAGLSQQRGSE